MGSLFDQGLSKEEILKQVGSIRQIAGAELFDYKSGKAAGASGIRVRNGVGLDFIVLPDKGLDIFDVSFKGTPLVWISNNGVVANQHFDEKGLGWLKSFAGGMFVTCGFRNVGPPVDESGEHFGLHGNYSALPAENLVINEYWEGNQFHIEISGYVRDYKVFGGNLENFRTISVSSGDSIIEIRDKIVNAGYKPEPLMLLYHFNWGSPLFNKNSILKINPAKTQVWNNNDQECAWGSFFSPQHGFEEIVYLHKLLPEDDDRVGYTLFNPGINRGVKVNWKHSELQYFTQWKMCGEGEYVLGLEPGNCFPTGRTNERKMQRLEILPSQAEKDICLKVEFYDQV